jgi:hypothetical protein
MILHQMPEVTLNDAELGEGAQRHARLYARNYPACAKNTRTCMILMQYIYIFYSLTRLPARLPACLAARLTVQPSGMPFVGLSTCLATNRELAHDCK